MAGSVNWGVLSTAKIGTEKVIPAIAQCERGRVAAIASRNEQTATEAAKQLNIEKAYGEYESLLNDPDIHAIYNPLPNHLHVPWTLKALAAGKHVLCEKPVGLNTAEAVQLRDAAAATPELIVMEAFMYRFHPQWQTAKQWIDEKLIGELLSVNTVFSYFNNDPDNIRNMSGIGGGGLMDIGCYPISQARFLFDREPVRVVASLDIDPDFQVDRVASAIMDFDGRMATFTCSTQMHPYQRVNIMGTNGRIEIEIPVNTLPDKPAKLWLESGDQPAEEFVMPVCDQYTLQADAMAAAILDGEALPVSLDDAVNNMRVIEAVVDSHHSRAWVTL
jgi:predicted dehydrogenase